ncbi:hypothetical protein G2W53_035695 [Senna tora]|uniref:Uncharacterized protein n=1 Tax=Senna tora TaxID=362788 RepID=A0A834SW51_9FABA|nr:hypothetical protein G2W53_035695 [Senna tora]
MASIKVEKPCCSQPSGLKEKKEPAKPSGTTPKAPASKPAPKKTERKSQPKKKVCLAVWESSRYKDGRQLISDKVGNIQESQKDAQ